MQSKPGPMLAIEAGTLTRMATVSRPALQFQDLSECAGIAVELDGRLDIFERRVRILEARAGQHDDRRRVLVDLSVADQPEEERERGGRGRLREQAFAAVSY